MPPFRLLILGGTGEARGLADAITERFGTGVEWTYSLAGRTNSPRTPSGQVRSGGFGGAAGLADYLRDGAFDGVVDATHPYARQVSANARAACSAVALPLLSMERAAWRPVRGDNWTVVPDLRTAAAHLHHGAHARVFLTTGCSGLDAFGPLREVFFLVRLIEPPRDQLPLQRCQIIADRGPFTVAGEAALMRRHRIDLLVTKASGGPATSPKLLAARRLGTPVLMLRRPSSAKPIGMVEALDWVASRLCQRRNADT